MKTILNFGSLPVARLAMGFATALTLTAAGLAQAQDGPRGPGAGGPMGMYGGMGPDGPQGMRGHGGAHGPMGEKMRERMLDQIKATPEQRTQMRKIHEAARADLKADHEAGRALHLQAQKLMAAPTLDEKALEQVRQQMAAHHDKVSKRMWQARVDAAKVLTPEQRKQLAERMQKRRDLMERHHRERRDLEGGTPPARS